MIFSVNGQCNQRRSPFTVRRRSQDIGNSRCFSSWFDFVICELISDNKTIKWRSDLSISAPRADGLRECLAQVSWGCRRPTSFRIESPSPTTGSIRARPARWQRAPRYPSGSLQVVRVAHRHRRAPEIGTPSQGQRFATSTPSKTKCFALPNTERRTLVDKRRTIRILG